MTPARLMEDIGLDWEDTADDVLESVCDAWEDGASDTFLSECERLLREATS